MKFYKFKLSLNSDQGKHKVTIAATDEANARSLIVDYFNCPERAILKVDNLGGIGRQRRNV